MFIACQFLGQKHLQDGTLVLYDVSSGTDTGGHCVLARYSHNLDAKKRFPQIVYGLLLCARRRVSGGHRGF